MRGQQAPDRLDPNFEHRPGPPDLRRSGSYSVPFASATELSSDQRLCARTRATRRWRGLGLSPRDRCHHTSLSALGSPVPDKSSDRPSRRWTSLPVLPPSKEGEDIAPTDSNGGPLTRGQINCAARRPSPWRRARASSALRVVDRPRRPGDGPVRPACARPPDNPPRTRGG
jgi:hypothetical protein